MRRVTLYIGGEKADLPDASPILFTWTREDLDNPTVVRNSYTQQLTLPGTPANDAIFGHFGRVERAYTPVVGQSTGIAFNPLKKASFALYADDATVLARGYAKLDGIQSRGGQAVSYTVSLYGGLGSLFYDLTYDDQGAERTLADLIYEGTIDPAATTMSVDRLTVAKLWGASIVHPDPVWKDVLTFAPCYNGLPSGEFDANKAVVDASTWYNFPLQTGYTPLGGNAGDGILATFAEKHTEWEVRDFRAYLQRPVVSVKAVLEALTDPQNTGEWSLALDGAFFTGGSNPWYDSAWMTLPMLQRPEDGDWTALKLSDALKGSCTPAAFLIGYAKMFGLVFDVDESARVVTLMARDDYYADAEVRDLTERIDVDTVDIKPCNASARWYEMKATQTEAEYTKEYAETYGRVYGSQRIDTGWEFDSDVKDLLAGFPFKGAADVLETSPYFYVNYYSGYAAQWGLAIVDGESVKYKLYDGSGNAQDFDAYVGQYRSKTVYRYGTAGFDGFPKVQLHGADGKASDGSGVLLLNVGAVTLPSGSGHIGWHVSDDSQEMLDVNEGRPCWYISGNAGVTSVSAVPHFRRMAGAQTMDFGAPREVAVPGESTGEGASVYYNRWRGYLTDRLDVDTKVLTCKVDWRGWQPGAGLLRHFYWYRNCLWSLNRIKDYAPGADLLTECEFVLVRDKAAYDSSQAVPAMENYYLNVSPATLTFNPAGQTLTITVTANVAWTLSVPAWITASAASGTGNATVVLTAGANSGSNRTGSVSLTGAHSTSASATAGQATNFVPSIAVTPTTKSIDNKARTFYYSITCNGAWRVKSINVGWLTCTSTGNGNGTATIGIAANTGDSSRTGIITFEMTDYPATTCTTYIIQAAPAAEMTYALELSSSSQTLPASGGSYTLVVTGVTYTDGVETGRTVLNQSALGFTKSGSAALSRAGLVFSAADLAFTQTAEETAVWTVYWSANGASATFTVKQEANVRSVIARQEDGSFPNVPATVTWNDSQVNEALAAGDVMYLNPTFHYEQTVTVVYTSRPGEQFYETAQADVDGAVQVVSGTGLSATGSGAAWTVTWAQNTGGTTRSGVLKIKQTGTNPYYPGYFYEETRSVTQAVASGIPSKLLISHDEAGQTVYVETAGKDVYGTYVRWYIGLDAYGHPVYVYSDLTPDRGESVYNESTLQTVYGTILDIVY